MSKFTINITRVMSILLFVFIVIASVSTAVFEIDFYTNKQEELNVASHMGLKQEDVTGATVIALMYTKGHTNDLSYNVEQGGETFDIYSSQDKEHMIDVQNLYRSAYSVMVFAFVMISILSIVLIVKRKEVNVFMLTTVYNKMSLYSIIFVAVLGIFAFANFNVFWTYFHKVFFTNDLWLMNPATDALVNLFPEALFSSLVFKIITRFTIIFGLTNVVAYGYRLMSMRAYKND